MSVNDAYKKWLADFGDDPHIGAELRAIGGDSEAVEDRFYRDLAFGTAGMRGVLGAGPNRMNAYVVRRATKALADYILQTPGGAQRGVAIAYDSRVMSDVFAKQAALVLANAMMGEVTPDMAVSVGSSRATRILVPTERCGTHVAGARGAGMQTLIDDAAQQAVSACLAAKGN